VAALVLEYYVLLRSVLRTKPRLRQCLVRCGHCGIFFLTDPSNGGRKNLGCPFGCREAHRRRQSTIRSVAYYQDPRGKGKKRDLNQKRRPRTSQGQSPAMPPLSCQARGTNQVIPTSPGQSAEVPSAPVAVPEASSAAWASSTAPGAAEPTPLLVADTSSNPLLLDYVRMVVSLIEGRPVSPAEILEMLQTFLRQHRLGRRRKIDHTVAWLHEYPP
jgi:hypothetical protein